jgi:hypothetical protein
MSETWRGLTEQQWKDRLRDEINYLIPDWCHLDMASHTDNMGGCWGISHGLVKEQGEPYCKTCEYHRDNVE